ncbi:MAG: hypothetical protein ACI9DF_003946 [Verrucomicrobiales bacterium]|jgi:uncharacterized protein (TIGR02599 family)
MNLPTFPNRRNQSGFTLIELLVSISILIMLLLMIFSMVDQTQRTWTRASAEANQFREARLGFESITRRVRQATLNTYWDYKFDSGGRPEEYIRQSELHFIMGETSKLTQRPSTIFPGHGIFFQAPFGYVVEKDYRQFTELLNAWGFFVEFGDDRESLPAFLRGRVQPKFRYRLKEFRLPSENFEIYEDAEQRRKSQSSQDNKWFGQFMGGGAKSLLVKRTLAENILMLVLTPMKAVPNKGSSAADTFYEQGYTYDSRFGLGQPKSESTQAEDNIHLLPSLVRVTMIAVDEKSALREERGANPPSLIPSGLFKQPKNLERDLRLVEEQLLDRRINHRIFSTTIAMREANWLRREKDDA